MITAFLLFVAAGLFASIAAQVAESVMTTRAFA